MGDPVNYLNRAIECVELARNAESDHERDNLLIIARAWQKLAESSIVQVPPDAPKSKD